ncbi:MULTISPECIES: LemA family protein [Flagellimonas]|uniref:LemA family protein n=1 Tax=Flagellimonas hadalis TaxID=2597517 RepID=A0A5N5INK5_9FLAO|nr:LemA family protein [Allomuricauda hadalis]KAB5488233.1 LemA family protein [Allomuricauda hadalis]RUA10713.1 MAG: LemA family protein [Flavobacteriia bacterium]
MTYAIIIFGALLLFAIFLFNNLISKKNKVHEAYSSIDVMLKKRTDLIPRLVNTVKGYMEHERATLTEITQLREKIISEKGRTNDRFKWESQLGMLLGNLQIRAEAYPELKSSENFLMLQASLNEVEEQLSAARRAYNAAVNAHNNALEMFPSNIMGKMMGYSQKTLFTIEAEEKKAPEVYFQQ